MMRVITAGDNAVPEDKNFNKSPRYCGAFIFRLVCEGGPWRFKVVQCQYHDLRDGADPMPQFKGVGGTSPEIGKGQWEDPYRTVQREVLEEAGLDFLIESFCEVLVWEVAPTHHQHFFLVVDATAQVLSPFCQKDEFEQLILEWVNLPDVWDKLTKAHLRGFRAALTVLFRQSLEKAQAEQDFGLAQALEEVALVEGLALAKLENSDAWRRPASAR